MLRWLQGKKTYITGAAAIVGTAAAVANGTMDAGQAITTAFNALLAMALRSAVKPKEG
jgi:hypothetical protein